MNVEDYLDTGEHIPILETRTPANALMLCLFFAVARSFDISIKESVNELKTDLLKVCATCEHIACIGPHELTEWCECLSIGCQQQEYITRKDRRGNRCDRGK